MQTNYAPPTQTRDHYSMYNATVVYVVNKNALKKHPFSAQSHQINISAKFKETEYKVTFWLCTH